MAEHGVAEFVRGREPLDRQRALRGHHDALDRDRRVRPREGFLSGRNITGMSRSTSMPNTSIRPSPRIGAGLRVKLLVQPVRLEDGVQDGVANSATIHPSFVCFLARRKSANRPSSSRSSGESSETLRARCVDVRTERDFFGLFAGEVS